MNGYYGKAGRFTLFALTILMFAVVIITFARWVDAIARLGRLGNTFRKVEKAAATAIEQRHNPEMRESAMTHERLALARAERAMAMPHDLELVRRAARFAES